MTRDKLFLQLLADDLCSLHDNSLTLEKDMRRLSLELESHNIEALAAVISQINCTGFAPIETMLNEAGVEMRRGQARAAQSGVLAEVSMSAQLANGRRIGAASAISIMRRSARYMELYCTSIADSAMRMRLTGLADHLRAWARDWIGLELNLNLLAARPRHSATAALAA